ncbi:hypothetical protein MCNS_36510 [Mycobacterium conspicuum]|uniref:Uncharacterized protein n=1 Tax=Mycobacterium conspicuum TaxID=44010 RepID=A0A1X1TF23_9MYCO|nr:hypothetical protein AWC00_10625 [Mycobacterium conspicuum]BBZ40588.1 hypothetical protein MCNS_36510 [Mycobacterium conspicuum]
MLYRRWLENAARSGVPAAVIGEIERRHRITPDSFDVLREMEEITDPDGKSFFLIPRDARGSDARRAVLMTYIFNADTGYATAGARPGATNDFPDPPYSAAEVQRIIDRQRANSWSYDRDVRFVHRNGARLVSTPNGMLMGLGGNWIQGLFSQQGGTAWGDIFMVNIDRCGDPCERLRQIVRSGRAWYTDRRGVPVPSHLNLDRVLHHEERHSAQWAAKGYLRMLTDYGWELVRERAFGKPNRLEVDAGLSDGGYA